MRAQEVELKLVKDMVTGIKAEVVTLSKVIAMNYTSGISEHRVPIVNDVMALAGNTHAATNDAVDNMGLLQADDCAASPPEGGVDGSEIITPLSFSNGRRGQNPKSPAPSTPKHQDLIDYEDSVHKKLAFEM